MSLFLYLVFLVFLLVFLVIAFFGHFFVYYSLIYFLGISQINYKILLGTVLFILPLCFILSSVAAHYADNFWTRWFYLLSSLWLGILMNLVIGFIGAWLISWLTKLGTINLSGTWLALAALIFAVAYSAYGVWNVFHPIVTNVIVKIKNLPVEWQGKNIVQISDVHLGHILKEDFLGNAVKIINSLNPQVVFITGDLLDGMDGVLNTRVSPLSNITAPLGTYFITGNHETYFGIEKSYEIIKQTKTKILDDEKVDLAGLQLVGISYPVRGFSKNIGEILSKIDLDKNKPILLLYHDPVQIQAAREAGVSLQLAGHTHKGQIFPINIITRLIYGKYYNGLNTEGEYNIYTSSGLGVWGPTMRTESKPEIVSIRLESL